ncbi:8721_t:CDS:2 [Dentiscutata erythropus]|uniref:8721_t:CDS:1 n=1 Tax=Dentiscutata erythropus TaxID=1348616 RepID=A0A9N8VJ32_9GLOM|nr:8721_t:CDS:2 [Dentiscutata erythropus]
MILENVNLDFKHWESVKDTATTTTSRVEVIKQANALKIQKLRKSATTTTLRAELSSPQDTKVTVSLDKRDIVVKTLY